MSEEIKEKVISESTGSKVDASSEISKSKAKRDARKAEVKAEKTKKNFDSILGWVIGIVIAAVVIGAIVMGILTTVNKTTSSSDFSVGLNEEGFVQNAKLEKVKDLALLDLKIPFSEVEYTDAEVDNDIASVMSANAYFDNDAALTVADGDTINLDYVGSIDGVEFEGGNTQGAGAELTIGSGSYIDDFEQQLIGSHPGDSVSVTVTFPEEYPNNPDLANKEAVFECVVNSVKVTPELTDEFVAKNYSDHASTVDELRDYIKNSGYESNVMTYISKYITENASAKAPSSYINGLKGVIKYSDEQNFAYTNQMYAAYYGYSPYTSFEDYTGKTEEEYEAYLKESAQSEASVSLTYEKFFKENSLTISDEKYNEILDMVGGEDAVATYGKPYVMQVAIRSVVLEYLLDTVTVE